MKILNSSPTFSRLLLRHFYLIFSLALFLPVANAGTANENNEAWPPLLVSADSLKQRLSDSNLVVLDVRPADEYKAGHISGAVNLPMALTYNQDEPTDRVGSIHYIQQLLSEHGIANNSLIVLYDDESFVDASRVLWTLEVYGHTSVGVLEVSYSEWEAMGLPNDTKPVTPQPKRFIATTRPEKMATKLSVRLALNKPNKVLLDARTREEYDGLESETARHGHIPGAVHINWNENLITSADGTVHIKPLTELSKVYSGFRKDQKIITYCNKGKRSALNYLALRMLGYDVTHYDGSWFDWSSDKNMPIVTPQTVSVN